jgi:hypothetical protein
MKKLILIIFTLFLADGVYATHEGVYDKDTVIIKFGKTSRIVIYVKDKEDLELLKQYDLNGMLKDLTLAIDSTGGQTDLRIEDNTGKRYLNDTSLVIEDVRVEEIEEEDEYDYEYEDDYDYDYDRDHDRQARVRIGNVEVIVDDPDFDRLEEDFEDFDFKDMEKREYYTERSLGTKHSFNIDIGFNDWLEDGKSPESNEPYKVRPFWSWYVGFNSTFKTSISGPLFLEWGGGIDWYNFKLEQDNIQIQQGDDEVEFIELPLDNPIKSKLTVNYINLKFVPMLDFSYGRKLAKEMGHHSVRITRYKKSGFRIGAGVYGGYRLTTYSKLVFKDEGDREKEHIRRSMFTNNWRYGIRVQMGYKDVDIFFTYDLNELFSEAITRTFRRLFLAR